MANDCSWDEARAQRLEVVKGCHADTALYKCEEKRGHVHFCLCTHNFESAADLNRVSCICCL